MTWHNAEPINEPLVCDNPQDDKGNLKDSYSIDIQCQSSNFSPITYIKLVSKYRASKPVIPQTCARYKGAEADAKLLEKLSGEQGNNKYSTYNK